MKISPLLRSRPAAATVAMLWIAPLVGCLDSEPPRFRANLAMMEKLLRVEPEQPEQDDDEEDEAFERREKLFESRLETWKEEQTAWEANRQTTINYIEGIFGTPNAPRVIPETGLDAELVLLASGPVRIDGTGKQQGLFRRHCVHCHGITGDGMGPTAAFLNPYPRDFRKGWFKFKSTAREARPTTISTFENEDGTGKEIVLNDLKRTLTEGIPRTAMPSFRTLPSPELDALIEYVRYLSLRGQMEESLFSVLNDAFDDDERQGILSRSSLLGEEMLGPYTAAWKDAHSRIIEPPQPTAALAAMTPEESIDEGRELFYGEKAKCYSCHGNEALGDGRPFAPDDWNELFANERKYDDFVAEGKILKSRLLAPRNLRQGVFRGGRRPVDIYRRIHTGIKGTPMQGFGGVGGAKGSLSSDEIWHLVHFVRNLQYEAVSVTGKTKLTKNERSRN